MRRTFFANEAIIPVVRVVCIAGCGTATISDHAEIEFWEIENISLPRSENHHCDKTYPRIHARNDLDGQSYVQVSKRTKC